jgi:hypothetical protein
VPITLRAHQLPHVGIFIRAPSPLPVIEISLADFSASGLTKFEENEIDKRLQLEVRVAAIEKHLGIDKKIAA